jgi:hypothetical protein
MTGDKSWMYDYDPETKQQSSQWKSPKKQISASVEHRTIEV